jgi:hypothetical protein
MFAPMIRQLAREGQTAIKIGRKLRDYDCILSDRAIGQILRKTGLPTCPIFLTTFKNGNERAEYAYKLFQKGETGAVIGLLLGVTPSRAYQLVHKGRRSLLRKEILEEKGLLKPRSEDRSNLGRPIDMGGPRDEWLTFYPSADPRIDVFTRGL